MLVFLGFLGIGVLGFFDGPGVRGEVFEHLVVRPGDSVCFPDSYKFRILFSERPLTMAIFAVFSSTENDLHTTLSVNTNLILSDGIPLEKLKSPQQFLFTGEVDIGYFTRKRTLSRCNGAFHCTGDLLTEAGDRERRGLSNSEDFLPTVIALEQEGVEETVEERCDAPTARHEDPNPRDASVVEAGETVTVPDEDSNPPDACMEDGGEHPGCPTSGQGLGAAEDAVHTSTEEGTTRASGRKLSTVASRLQKRVRRQPEFFTPDKSKIREDNKGKK